METVDFTNQDFCHYLYAVVDLTAAGSELEQPELSLVSYRDIACVLTTVPTSEYCKDVPSNPSEQLEWVAPRVMKHHQVLMEMLTRTTIVPFTFGTLCASTEEVQSMLATRYERLRGLLEQLRGKEEWIVSVYIDPANLVQHLEANQQQIQELDSLIAQKNGGEAYLLRKKKLKITDTLQKNVLDEIHDECHRRLRQISNSVFETRCGSPHADSVQVLSAAVLSPSTNFELLERTTREIETRYFQYSASVCLSGPWPAYSTVSTMLANT